MSAQHTPEAPHRIQSLRFEFDGPDESSLLRLRTRAEDLCERELPELLGEIFDDLAARDELLEIPRLDIHLGEINASELDPSAIAAATRRALSELPRARKALSPGDGIEPAAVREPYTASGPVPLLRPLRAQRMELFIDYLLHGDLGAVQPDTPPQNLLDEARTPESILGEILNALSAIPAKRLHAAVMRLLAVAPGGLLAAMANHLSASGGGAAAQLIDESGTDTSDCVEAIVAALRPGQVLRHRDRTPPPDAPEEQERAQTDERPLIQAPNAGLVLVHVFLPQLFGRLDLLRERQFRDDSARVTAVRLLHYLASADSVSDEPLLVVPKLLCGVGAETPVLERQGLAPAALVLADNLIDSAIAHWKKVGNTSPAGLRETFLSRPGLIRGYPDRPRLIVERRGVDVLLGSLPWALSPVRLPWLDQPLPVDWG